MDLTPKTFTSMIHNNYHFNNMQFPPNADVIIKEFSIWKIRRKYVNAVIKWLANNPQIENLNFGILDSDTIHKFLDQLNYHQYLSIKFNFSTSIGLNLKSISHQNNLQRLNLERSIS